MGTENKSVVARNEVRGAVDYKKSMREFGVDDGTVLYLDCNDFTQLYVFLKTH